MTLPIPFYIYGTIRDGKRDTIDGASVSVDTESTSTDSNGNYQLNIQDVATDGGVVTVNASSSGRNSRGSFTLDIGDVSKRVNIVIHTLDVKVIKSNRRFHVMKSDKSFKINYNL